MRALTSPGVSHQEKDGQSSWKNVFFCGLLHFSCDGKSYDECACRFLSASQSKCILCDLCWRVFFFFVAWLFLNKGTVSGTVLSASQLHDWGFMLSCSNETAHLLCLFSTQQIGLSCSPIDLTNLRAVAHLHSALNSWHSASVPFRVSGFPCARL